MRRIEVYTVDRATGRWIIDPLASSRRATLTDLRDFAAITVVMAITAIVVVVWSFV